MVYKSQKAASLYSEFANSKNLKEAKIMPGTFNGTTLTISATPVDGALIPDKSATNVAGIAIVGSDMYCVCLLYTSSEFFVYIFIGDHRNLSVCERKLQHLADEDVYKRQAASGSFPS